MTKNNISLILIFTILFFVSMFAFSANSNPDDNFCLSKSYNAYKKVFMTKEGRVIDYDENENTTSEGQSYMMLRSLMMDDRKTFDLAYKWTKNNLQRQDKLFSWLWGKNDKGADTILDENSASDADIDIAFSLVLAYEKWKNYQYLESAKQIINSIWVNETKYIGNYLVLMPGISQTKDENIEINPSYFSPYAFRLFQKYDELHDWNLIIDSSYYYLDKVMFKTKTGLPPDWFSVKNGEILLSNSSRSDFSYDAVRVFIRIYLDYTMAHEKRAIPVIEKANFFIYKWNKDKTIYTNYQKNGQLRNKDKFLGAISILLPSMDTYNNQKTKEIYQQELEPVITSKNYWDSKNNYYGKNLTWFGLYLYEEHLKGCKIKDN